MYLFYLPNCEYSNKNGGLKIGDVVTITVKIGSGLISL